MEFNLESIPENGDGIPEFDEEVRALCQRFAKRAIAFEVGRNRLVFIMKHNYVVKIPIHLDGITDNDWEGSNSEGDDPYIRLPRTRIHYGKVLPILFMEYVKPTWNTELCSIYGKKNVPDWVMSVDGGQVGFTRKGKLVAYDYGIR